MPDKPVLLPYPRSLVITEGSYTTTDDRTVNFVLNADIVPQGYRLQVTPRGIRIEYGDMTGAHYARLTLSQLSAFYGTTLPAMRIDDAPDFERRGVMLDCSRDRVPQMKTLYALIDLLASWKINELQLYIEHTFAYAGHESVWEHASPFTASDMRALVDYCKQRYIDLVPCQSSLGHMERWLKHPQYQHLAETPDGFVPHWETLGIVRPPATLDPNDEGSLDLVAGLFDQLVPLFHSHYVNICDDEPFELGMGKSKTAVAQRGGAVYLEYLLKLYHHVAAKGRRVQFWSDIITQHPDLVSELPDSIIPLVWGYEDWQPSEQDCEMVSQSALDFYICPGTSSWNSLVGRTDNAIGNLKNAAALGLKYNAMGYLNTDWGDNGHMQPLPVSYLGFVYGAGLGWCVESNREVDLPALLDRFAFGDRAGMMGQIAYDLGNVYQLIPLPQFNGSWLFRALEWSADEMRARYHELLEKHGAEALTPAVVRAAMTQITALIARIDGADMSADDTLIRAEFKQAAELLLHGAYRTLRMLGDSRDASSAAMRIDLERLIGTQRSLWLERSRPGGLDDSLARLRRHLAEYR